jgi:hypothetical protein
MRKARFESEVASCCAELAALLPAIADRRSPLALLAALAEHVGGALQLLLQDGGCTPAQARAVLTRCEKRAFEFPDDPATDLIKT